MTSGKVFWARRADQVSFDFFGLSILDYTAGRARESSLAVIDVAEGIRHPIGFSTRCEKTYFVLSGSVHFEVENEPFDLSFEDLLVIPAGNRFWYTVHRGTARLLLMHTPPFDPNAEVIEEAVK